ncbi:MAG: hypothetical protein ABSC48_11740 [Terracidiphilus sp.]|jgi:hypothetical protein
MEELAAVVAISRLVHPTTTGLRYAARVSLVNGQVRQILAFQPRGVSVDVFWSKADRRDWLTIAEAQHIKLLMPLIMEKRLLPKRIHNAYWHHEYAMRTYYVDHRWVLISTGLDALVNIDPYQGQKKFVSRVNRLAQSHSISLTENELEKAYKLRSSLVHGQQFLSDQGNKLTDAEIALYDKIEEVLRRTLLRAFEDNHYATHFRDE